MSYMNKHASLLAATSQVVEVSGLKQSLERALEELGLVKKAAGGQARYVATCCIFRKNE